jgi:hypothetical protein
MFWWYGGGIKCGGRSLLVMKLLAFARFESGRYDFVLLRWSLGRLGTKENVCMGCLWDAKIAVYITCTYSNQDE